MRFAVRFLAFILVVAAAIPAFSDDQKNAEKQIMKIKAMAWDHTARQAVNKSIAETFKADRAQLVQARRLMNIDYGSLFLLEDVSAITGTSMDELAKQVVDQKKTAVQVATEHNIDWKRVQNDAKKMNSLIEKNLREQFATPNKTAAADTTAHYDPAADGLAVDNDVPQDQISQAGDTFSRLQQLASDDKKAGRIDDAGAMTARHDQIQEGSPGQAGSATSVNGLPK